MTKARTSLVRGAIACAALLVPAASLQATGFEQPGVYFDNLIEAPTSSSVIDSSSFYAQSFITDASAANFTLESVTLAMNTALGSPNGFFLVDIYTDNAGNPGTSIQSLSGNHSPLTAGDYEYGALSVTLQPTTTYWIVAHGLNGLGAYGWNYAFSSTNFGTWPSGGSKSSPEGGGLWLSNPGAVQMMSIAATPHFVPEPSAATLLAGSSALGLLAWRARRRT